MNTKKHNFATIIDCVREFHDAFGIANGESPQGQLDEGTVRLRHRLMAEETEEYLEAALAGDAVEVADALGDQLYILCGTILSHGMQHVIERVAIVPCRTRPAYAERSHLCLRSVLQRCVWKALLFRKQ